MNNINESLKTNKKNKKLTSRMCKEHFISKKPHSIIELNGLQAVDVFQRKTGPALLLIILANQPHEVAIIHKLTMTNADMERVWGRGN